MIVSSTPLMEYHHQEYKMYNTQLDNVLFVLLIQDTQLMYYCNTQSPNPVCDSDSVLWRLYKFVTPAN